MSSSNVPHHSAGLAQNTAKSRSKVTLSRTLRPSLVTVLRLVWVLVISFQESYIWKSYIADCAWSRWQTTTTADHHLMLIGDPQLVDENTYARRGLALKATQFYADLYMKRNYRLLHKILKPQTTIFTGDLFDGGREWADDGAWTAEYDRFRRVFPAQVDNTAYFNLPGNHDIGITTGMQPVVYERFVRHFGNTSVAFDAGSWQIVLLDSISLTSSEPALAQKAQAFMSGLGSPSKPRLLVTHIPLYRPADSSCGPMRESSKGILIQGGYQYQNVLLPETSDAIWKEVQPSLIFAGDDHDYCDHVHARPSAEVHEINVKSFSWTMGIQEPGFQLVALNGKEYETHLCLLPGQLPLFINYGVLLLLTIIAICASQFYKGPKEMRGWSYLPLTTFESELDNQETVHRVREGAKAKGRGPLTLLDKMKKAMWQLMMVGIVAFVWYLYMIWW
jgi:hypothetical protein